MPLASVTIPHILGQNVTTGRIDNFLKAAKKMPGEHKGQRYNDTDVYKIIEAASYSLVLRPDPALDAKLDEVIAIVTAVDARLVEFSAAGQIAQRPFGIEFALRARDLRSASSVTDADFDIAARPGDIVLQGSASSNPMWDVVERALAAIPQQPSR